MSALLVVTTSYPCGASGSAAAGTFVRDVARELAARVRVVVVAPENRDGRIERTGSNPEVVRFVGTGTPLSLLRPAHPADWPRIATVLARGQRAVRQAIARERFDHVLALWTLPSGYWARRAADPLGIPYSCWALGSDIWSLGRLPLVRSVLRATLRGARHCLADGLVLADDVSRLAGRPCHFVPSGRALVAGPVERRLSPPYRLAFLGRWHPNKGIDLLLGALAELPPEAWSRIEEVRIFGGGPLETFVHARVDSLRRAGRPVMRGGYLDEAEATALYSWADFTLVPSRIESIPVVFSDAAQCRSPVIATPVGDLPRLVTGSSCGILATDGSSGAIARAITDAVERGPGEFLDPLADIAVRFHPRGVAATLLDLLLGDP